MGRTLYRRAIQEPRFECFNINRKLVKTVRLIYDRFFFLCFFFKLKCFPHVLTVANVAFRFVIFLTEVIR